MLSSRDRAALAFRTAVAVLLVAFAGWLVVPPLGLPQMTTTGLAVILAFLSPAARRGESCAAGLTWVMSTILLFPTGFATCYLCFLVGGMQWRPWLVCICMGATASLVVIWAAVAAEVQAPKPLLAGNAAAVVLALLMPVIALSPTSHEKMLVLGASMCLSILLGTLSGLAVSYLPCGLGATPAHEQVPCLTAAKLAALAETFEAAAIFQLPTKAALQRHRQCRLKLLSSGEQLAAAMKFASFEATELRILEKDENSQAQAEDPSKALLKLAERCRLALQMKSSMLCAGFSNITLDTFYRGIMGERLRDVCFSSAHALRAAAATLSALSGKADEAFLTSASWMGADLATKDDCREQLAEQCRKSLQRYMDSQLEAAHDPLWRTHAEETLRQQFPMDDDPNGPDGISFMGLVDLYLKGAHHLDTQDSVQAARVAGFDEACRHSCCVLGVKAAAEAAAAATELIAERVSEPEARGPCRLCALVGPSFTGARSWLRVPCAGREAWKKGLAKGRSHALRLGIAVMLTGFFVIYVLRRFNEHDNGLWTLLTVAMGIMPMEGASLLRGLRRLAGTAVGSLLALASVAAVESWPVFPELTPHICLLALVMKFYEPELQFAGAITFVTYLVILLTLIDSEKTADGAPVMPAAESIALRRCVDVAAGVMLAMVANVFIAPDRAVDQLRLREATAIRTGAEALKEAGRVLWAKAAKMEVAGKWEQLKLDTWKSVEELQFAGDGHPGKGDLLEEVLWESRWGVDGGFLVLGRILWVPGWAPSVPGRRCINAVIAASRLVRITNVLCHVLEPGLEEGAQRPLQDERVLSALGPEATDFTALLDEAVERLAARLAPDNCSRTSSTKKSASAWPQKELEALEQRLERLFVGSASARHRNGGLVGESKSLGGLRAAAALKLVHGAVDTLITLARQLEGSIHEDKHSLTMSLSRHAVDESESESTGSSDEGLC